MKNQLTLSAANTALAFINNNAAKYHLAVGTGLVVAVMAYDKKAKQVRMGKTYRNQVSQVPKRTGL